MSDLFTPSTFNELLTNALNTVSAESNIDVDTSDGAVLRALMSADVVNHLFIQSQVSQLALNTRIDTATGADLDTLVNQFAPPFTPRIRATAATSGPLAPTTLMANASSTYLWVASIQGMAVGQALRVAKAGKGANTTINTIQPTTTLTVAAAQGALVLNVASTTGMAVGMILNLTDGNFSTTVTITSINSATQVGIAALTSAISHTYATATTIVTLNNVLLVAALTLDAGTLLTDLTLGATVTATSMLEGVYFFRNKPDASMPQIPARVTDNLGNVTQSGYILQTRLDGVQFEVVADSSNAAYNSGIGAYQIPANTAGVYVKVQAVVPGTASNIIANALTVLPSPLSGVDGAKNFYPIQTGTDDETDDALRTRFRNFISSLSNSTLTALQAAVGGVQAGLQYSVLENVASDGVTSAPGNIVVVVSDANGVLSTDLYNRVYAAVNKARALTTTFVVKAPQLITPNIALTVTVLSGYNAADVKSAVQTAIFNSFSGTAAGGTLEFNSLVQLAKNVTGVDDVTAVSVNGNGYSMNPFTVIGAGPANVTAGPLQLLRPPLANIVIS